VAARGKFPTRAFYEAFADEDECVRAVFDEGAERISRAVDEATGAVVNFDGGQTAWVARVRAGLVALLGFLDDEPAWGRLLLLQAPRHFALGLEARPTPFRVLHDLIEPGEDLAGIQVPELAPLREHAQLHRAFSELTTDLVVGGVFAVIRTYLAEAERDGAIVELTPSLMAFVVTPYLGQAGASAELAGMFEPGASVSFGLSNVRRHGTLVRLPTSSASLAGPVGLSGRALTDGRCREIS
jgi:AcrR family transcriptional regulator